MKCTVAVTNLRRHPTGRFVGEFTRRHGPDSPEPQAVLEDCVAGSPLVKVDFPETG